jgi:hypothetical protein
LEVGRYVKVLGELSAEVRVEELVYADGTSGFSANLVLNKTGDEALKAAVEIARSGKWPPPGPRPKRDSFPAPFVEKPYADQPYPGAEYRMLAAARIWLRFRTQIKSRLLPKFSECLTDDLVSTFAEHRLYDRTTAESLLAAPVVQYQA